MTVDIYFPVDLHRARAGHVYLAITKGGTEYDIVTVHCA